jgi:Signal transduction histidine kinase
VRNLVENAIKFTPEGGEVQVRARPEDGETVLLEVEDTGVGIAEEAREDIFDAFKQESEGLGREYEGSGLGLSIVGRLTTVMGGTIEVESEKGVGTRFAVRLPR